MKSSSAVVTPAVSTPADTTSDTTVVSPIRVIKAGTCKSLSGKSDLTYHIGADPLSNIHARVFANSSSGYFSQEWIPYAAIQAILATYPQVTSFSLRPLYVGKSTNSPGFLLAALKAEGLVKLKGEKERVYIALDAEPFIANMKALMETQPDVPATTGTPAIKKSSSGKGSPK